MGSRRSVLIIPELTFNAGWAEITEKVSRLISSHKGKTNLEAFRIVDENIPYAEMVKGFKWENRVRRGVNGDVKEGIISIKWPLCSEVLTAQKESGGRIQCRFYTIRNLEMNWSWKVVWEWRKTPFKLSWWGPLADTKGERNTSSSTWVKVIGLPLHL
ncbi:hypothetical protein KY289_026112 [Solanum tuberosum]|nr:hypothetical protein KY289_026112 [Solanum tuberosum]